MACFVQRSSYQPIEKEFPMRFFGSKVVVVLSCVLAMFVLITVPVCYGQAVASMAGTVTDRTGAVIPGVTVTLTNSTTGAKYTETTNSLGFYRFPDIPPGAGYQVTFSAKGFAKYEVKDIYLTAATVRTQNAALTIGGAVSTVEVSAAHSEVTIDTTDASVGNSIDVEALNDLPAQQRNSPTALFELQPGVTSTGAVAGARVDQNYVTVDGLDVNDLATGGVGQSNSGAGVVEGIRRQVIVGSAPVDSVEQFTADVAGAGATTGAGSGGDFQLVTKGGTNKFHGNLNEYHRDPSLVANSWFGNNSGLPRNHLIQNQFGGNIGGPIKRDKAFFFFDFNDSRLIRSVLVQRTVPLDTMRGDNPGGPVIGYLDNTSSPGAPSVSYLTAAQLQAMDPANIGFDSTWVSGYTTRFPHSNNMITGDGVNSGGYNFNAPDNDIESDYVGRVDYNLGNNHKFFAKFAFTRDNAVQNPNEFKGDPATDPFIDRSYNFVLGYSWLIGTNKTNRVFLGEAVQKNQFPDSYNPDGTTFFTFDDGTGPALASSLYLNPAASARRVPIPVLGDDFSWTKGRHTLQWGGTFKDILAHTTNVADYNATELGMGGNVLSLCGPTPAESAPACGAGHFDLRPSSIYEAPSNATAAQSSLQDQAVYDWDQAYGFDLARIGEVSADFNYDKSGNPLKQLSGDTRMYRNYQLQLYFSDAWKITPNLTATWGVTYQWYSVPYETRGLESVEPYSVDQYMKARVAQSAAGQSGATAVPLINYYLGGKGNGGSAPGLYQPQKKLFAPHIGFAWNPSFDRKMVINFGGGLVYDRTIIMAIMGIQDSDSYLFQQSKPIPLGIGGDPWDSFATGPRLDSNNNISAVNITAPASPVAPYAPFTSSSFCGAIGYPAPCGLALGSAFNATIDPTLKTPYSIQFNAGVQHELRGDMVLKTNFVGRLGRRLLGQPDVNQVLDFPDTASGQLLSTAFGNVTKQLRQGATFATITPQPWFEDIMGAGYTQFLVANWGPFAYRGDFGDTVWFLAATGAPQNIGSAAQFSENTFYSNKGFSNYYGLLVTLQKNASHGLKYDINYTLSHSIDNTSFFANSAGDTGIGGIGLICDIIRPRECRANSDFDVRNYITVDADYELPVGRGKQFANTVPSWGNEIIGGWSISGISIWHGGYPWSDNSNAFVASYSNDAPGIIVGPRSAIAPHIYKIPGGGVNIFGNGPRQAAAAGAFEGPIGFQIGPRNTLRGPKYFNADLGLAKTFPIYKEIVNLKFRADAFNAFNHPNFDLPAENVYNGLDQQDFTSNSFGQISYTVEPAGNFNNGARVLQLSLRLEF